MADRYRLRPTVAADLPELVALESESFSDPWTEPQLRAAIEDDSTIALAAESVDGSFAASLLVRGTADQGEVLSISVGKPHRRSGLGTALLEAGMVELQQIGVSAVWLEVRASNDAARLLYEAAGFEVSGMRPGYYRRPLENALIMTRSLGEL